MRVNVDAYCGWIDFVGTREEAGAMYRKSRAIGVFAAVAVLAFVAAPLQAQTTSAVAPPTCATPVNPLSIEGVW